MSHLVAHEHLKLTTALRAQVVVLAMTYTPGYRSRVIDKEDVLELLSASVADIDLSHCRLLAVASEISDDDPDEPQTAGETYQDHVDQDTKETGFVLVFLVTHEFLLS